MKMKQKNMKRLDYYKLIIHLKYSKQLTDNLNYALYTLVFRAAQHT